MENEGKYLVVNKNDNSIEASMVRDEIRERPIEQLEFVKEVKCGNITIGNMEIGRKIDGSAEIQQIASLIELIIKIETKGRVINLTEVTQYIKNIEDNKILNINSVIKERSAKFWGYLKDRAILNSARAKQN